MMCLKTLNYLFRQFSVYAGSGANITKISSCGLDGKVVVWDIKVS